MTTVLAVTVLAASLVACGNRVTADTAATGAPGLVWYYYNPISDVPEGWEGDWKTSPQKIDASKDALISGTGFFAGGMRSSRMSAQVYGECSGADQYGVIMTKGYGYSYLDKNIEDRPPVTDGKADAAAGPVMTFTSAELVKYFKTGIGCTLTGSQGQPFTGTRRGVNLTVHAVVTTVAGVTRQGDFVLTP